MAQPYVWERNIQKSVQFLFKTARRTTQTFKTFKSKRVSKGKLKIQFNKGSNYTEYTQEVSGPIIIRQTNNTHGTIQLFKASNIIHKITKLSKASNVNERITGFVNEEINIKCAGKLREKIVWQLYSVASTVAGTRMARLSADYFR